MREEHSRLRKQEQTLLRKSMPETLLRKPGGQHGCQITQGKGNIGGGEAGRLPAASGPHLSQLQLCNHGQLSVVQFPHLQNTIYLAGYRGD